MPEARLVKNFSIARIATVIGYSYGLFWTFQWGVQLFGSDTLPRSDR
jgi:homoserine acetyltransferase